YVNGQFIKQWNGFKSDRYYIHLEAGRQKIKWVLTGGSVLSGGRSVYFNSMYLPAVPDSDEDGILDSQEYLYYDTLGLTITAETDTDTDGITDIIELENGSNPTVIDSDADGLTDLQESEFGSSPKLSDTDGDTVSDLLEFELGSNPNSSDTDNDGMPDGWEVDNALNILLNDADSDNDSDGYSNYDEYQHGTNPNDASSMPVLA
ncbi:MAG: hypothetical protein RPR91_11855, partial [Colwellia sp.]